MLYYGILESVLGGILWWIVLALVVLFGGFRWTLSAKEVKVASLMGYTVLLLAAVHLLGIYDVATLVWKTPLLAIKWTWIYLAFGFFIYMPIRGYLKLKTSKSELEQAIRAERISFYRRQENDIRSEIDRENEGGRSGRGMARVDENEVQRRLNDDDVKVRWEAHREAYKARLLSVDKHKDKIFYWSFAWLPDLLYKVVFQFFARLNDLWEFGFKAIRRTVQRIINRELGSVGNDI